MTHCYSIINAYCVKLKRHTIIFADLIFDDFSIFI